MRGCFSIKLAESLSKCGSFQEEHSIIIKNALKSRRNFISVAYFTRESVRILACKQSEDTHPLLCLLARRVITLFD